MSSHELGRPDALTHFYLMGHDETQAVDLAGEPLSPPEVSEARYGLAVPQVAEIMASKHVLSVLDTRHNHEFGSPLIVVDSSFRESGQIRGYKPIWEGQAPQRFGRAWDTDRFSYPDTVSANHFSVAMNGLELYVTNLRPTNNTTLSGNLIGRRGNGGDDAGVIANYTVVAQQDLRGRSEFRSHDVDAPYGYYRGHAIIGRDSLTVRDGVYFTTRPRSEAVVVDDQSKELKTARYEIESLAYRRLGRPGQASTKEVLGLVNELTNELMPYDLDKTERISQPHYDTMGLINLSEYLRQRAGVCRHQNLLAAVLMEVVADRGYIDGTVGVQRNHVIELNGAHAWSIFKPRGGGDDIIVDPAQKFIGTREEARAKGLWNYYLAAEN
jgi:hypothetical protein